MKENRRILIIVNEGKSQNLDIFTILPILDGIVVGMNLIDSNSVFAPPITATAIVIPRVPRRK
jgi:hypothetical protein